MKNAFTKIGLLLFGAMLPLLMAPSGGYPTNPTFLSAHVNGPLFVTGTSTLAGVTSTSETTGALIATTGNFSGAISTTAGTLTSVVVNSASSTSAITVNSGNIPSVNSADAIINRAGSTANNIAEGPSLQLFDTTNNTASVVQQSGGQTEFWQFNGGWQQFLVSNSTRNLTIPAPASASPALTVNQNAGNGGIQIDGPTTQEYLEFSQSSTPRAYFGVALSSGALSGDAVANDVVIRSQGGAIRFTTNSGASSQFVIGAGLFTPGLGDPGTGALNISGSYSINNGPAYVGFDVNLVVGPTFVNCHHCQVTPTVVRNSIGNYTVTPLGAGFAIYDWSCTIRNNATAPGFISINSVGAGAVTLLGWSTAGALADPGTVECVGVN